MVKNPSISNTYLKDFREETFQIPVWRAFFFKIQRSPDWVLSELDIFPHVCYRILSPAQSNSIWQWNPSVFSRLPSYLTRYYGFFCLLISHLSPAIYNLDFIYLRWISNYIEQQVRLPYTCGIFSAKSQSLKMQYVLHVTN